MKTFLKRLLIGLLSIFLFIALGVFVVTLVVDPNQFKSDIQSTAANAGVELDIDGDLEWQLLPFGLSAEKVNFVLSDQSMAGSADQFRFGIGASTLISFARQHSQLPISQLSITNGRVLYALPNSLPLQFSQIDLSINDVNSAGKLFPIRLSLLAPKGLKISLDTELGIQLSKQTLTDISIANLQLNVNHLSINGYLNATDNLTKIQGQINTKDFDLIQQFKLAKRFIPDLLVPKMADVNALTNVSFDSFFDIEADGLSKIQTTLKVDGQSLDIDVDIDQPQYKLNTVVSGKTFNLDAYQSRANSQSNNSMLFAPLAIPMAVWHGQSQFELNLMAVEMGGITLSNLYANLFGNQNIFRLTSLNGDIFDGHFNATGSLNLQDVTPNFSFSSSFKNIDLSAATQSMDNINIGGRLNFETTITGYGDTSESLLQSMDGDGIITIDKPKYMGVNLEQTLCNAAAVFGGNSIPKKTWSENTKFEDINAKLQFKNGRLFINDYQTKLENIDFYGNAEINLSSLRYSFNTTALATQSTSSPQGCNINPMIVKREIPFRCKGALGDSIKCKPDNNLIQTLLLTPKL